MNDISFSPVISLMRRHGANEPNKKLVRLELDLVAKGLSKGKAIFAMGLKIFQFGLRYERCRHNFHCPLFRKKEKKIKGF